MNITPTNNTTICYYLAMHRFSGQLITNTTQKRLNSALQSTRSEILSDLSAPLRRRAKARSTSKLIANSSLHLVPRHCVVISTYLGFDLRDRLRYQQADY